MITGDVVCTKIPLVDFMYQDFRLFMQAQNKNDCFVSSRVDWKLHQQ